MLETRMIEEQDAIALHDTKRRHKVYLKDNEQYEMVHKDRQGHKIKTTQGSLKHLTLALIAQLNNDVYMD